jgi:hypothetical protein
VEDSNMRSDLQYPAHSLGQIVGRLPASARVKYRSIGAMIADQAALAAASTARRQDLDDGAVRLVERLQRLDPRTQADDIADVEEELGLLRDELAKLAAARDRRNSILGNLQQTVSQIDVWLQAGEAGINNIPAAGALVAVEPAEFDEAPDIEHDLPACRREIAGLKSEIARLAGAPLPAAEIKANIAEQIHGYATNGRPRLRLEGDKIDLRFADQPLFAQTGALAAPASSVISTLAWLFQDRITELLTAGIDDEVAARGGGISTAEREARRAELEVQILELEYEEEALVEHALARGLEVHRRRNANPMAILGVALMPIEEVHDDEPTEAAGEPVPDDEVIDEPGDEAAVPPEAA